MTGSQRHRSYDRMRIFILCGLIALVVAEWILVQPGTLSRRPTGLTASIDLAEQRSLISAAPNPEAYSSIITSDLFAESREAPPGVRLRISPAGSAEGSTDMRVTGIVTFGTERVAIIARSGAAEPVRVRIGDAVAGSKVSQITPSYVVLQSNGLERILTVEHQVFAGEAQVASAVDSIPGSAATALESYDRAAKATMDEFMGSRQFDSLTTDTVPPNPPDGP